MKKEEILAVHKNKLEEFLRELDLWDALVKGELKCAVCGKPVSLDSIGLIIPSGDKVTVCCANAVCMFKIKELRGEQK